MLRNRSSTNQDTPDESSGGPRYADAWILVILTTTFFLYKAVLGFDFVNYDDQGWVSGNAFVRQGVSLNGCLYAFTANINGTWNPLAVLSLQLDNTLFGFKPGMFHLMNLWFHLANIFLVYSFIKEITKNAFCGLVSCLFFAIHPVNVESVCWISERKGLLGTMFTLLTLISYLRSHRTAAGAGASAWTFVFYLLALLSKPTAVAIPLVFLLCDVWPLKRIDHFDPRKIWLLCREKWLWFTLAFIETLVLLQSESKSEGGLIPLAVVSVGDRAQNAIVSLTRYLGHLAWPGPLNVCYFYRPWNAVQALVSAGIVLGLTLIGFRLRRRFPFLLLGIGFFILTLLPTLQFVQLGHIGMADRYQYLPSIGIFLPLSWLMVEFAKRGMNHRVTTLTALATLCALLMVRTNQQIQTWRNSGTLFTRAVAVNPYNGIARLNLALYNSFTGDSQGAVENIMVAVQVMPGDYFTLSSAADILIQAGKYSDAFLLLDRINRQFPNNDHIHGQLAWLLSCVPELHGSSSEKGLSLARQVVLSRPIHPRSYRVLAAALAANGSYDEAVKAVDTALECLKGSDLPLFRRELEAERQTYLGHNPWHLSPVSNKGDASWFKTN